MKTAQRRSNEQWHKASTNNSRLSATWAWDIGREREDEWGHPASRSSELTVHMAHHFSWNCTLRWQGVTRAWLDQNGYWMIWTLHSRSPSLGQIWEGLLIHVCIPVLQALYFLKVNWTFYGIFILVDNVHHAFWR